MRATRTGRLNLADESLERDYLLELFNGIREAIVVVNVRGVVLRVNQEFCHLFGYHQDEAQGAFLDHLVGHPESVTEISTIIQAVADGRRVSTEVIRRRKDGTGIEVSLLTMPILTRNHPATVIAIYRDISDRKRAEEALLREKAHLDQLVEAAPESIVILGPDHRILRFNAEFCRMFGFEPSELPGLLADRLIVPEDHLEEAAALTKATNQGTRFSTETLRRRKDGSLLHVSIIGSPIVIEGTLVGSFGIYRDITDRKAAEQALLQVQRQVLAANLSLQERTVQLEEANAALERLSNIDALTSISNRRYFELFLGTEWRRACREKHWISLVMMDVDHFKAYNDCYGHLAGDACLRAIAQALAVVHRAGDLVARYGGEEFVAVLANTDQAGAMLIAERLRQGVKDLEIPHARSQVSPFVTLSLGIASRIPKRQADALDLLKEADQALYLAKSRGRDRVGVMAE